MLIFLSFANDASLHLDLLKAESRDIQAALRPLEKKQYIRVKADDNLTADDIIQFLINYPDELGIFHYGGHANGAKLQLEGGDANAGGLAKLLGEQKNLKLVFLNGCSTKAQVKLLLAAGVKAVIATSAPIADTKAKDFAVTFYDALANRRTVQRAFDMARNALELKYRKVPTIKMTRGMLQIPDSALAGGDDTEGVNDATWELYLGLENVDEIGDFRLPTYQKIANTWVSEIVAKMSSNKNLALVLDEMCAHNPDIYHQMVKMQKGIEVQKDSSTYLDLVVQNFPFVIGAQIQLLRQNTDNNRARLEQLISTYLVVGQTLYYVLLSDLWSHKDKMKFAAPKNFAEQHVVSLETFWTFPFFDKIVDVYALFPTNDNLFVPEFAALVAAIQDKNTMKSKAIQYFEKLKTETIADDAVAVQCERAEKALAIVLNAAAFLANYQMLTVRNIELNNPRTKKEIYELQIAPLNAIVHTSLNFYNDDIYRRKAHYTNCDSVVLVSANELLNQEESLGYYLNLSPFLIDKNTFLKQPQIDLYLYAYEGKADKKERYHYWSVRHNAYLALANAKGTDIVHTDMTHGDFKEGRNITEQAKDNFDDFDLSAEFGTTIEKIESSADLKPVFTNLSEQFEQFRTEFIQI